MTSQHCDRPFLAGTTIMGLEVRANPERAIVLTGRSEGLPSTARGGREEPQYYYLVGEEVKLELQPKIMQAAWEVTGPATFLRGKCGAGKRSSERAPVLRMLSRNATDTVETTDATEATPEGRGDVTVTTIWAKSLSGGVQLAPHFLMRRAGGVEKVKEEEEVEEEEGGRRGIEL
jgi:hypothetical protein